jgi:hypothetical protein
MYRVGIGLLMITVFAFVPLAKSEECEALKSGSILDVTDYLRHARDDAADAICVRKAFHQLAGLPPEQAIPLLIKYLGYKRPLGEGERQGIFMHGNGPEVLYPAVHELYVIGNGVEPQVMKFIGQSPDATVTELSNASYVLLLIHHGNVIEVIKTLVQASSASGDNATSQRLQAAAKDAVRWCDDAGRKRCEDALK